MTEDDVVLWFLRRMVDRMGSVDANEVIRLEQEMRQHWGGSRPYIGKRTAFANHGEVPRSTFYRWGLRRR